MTDEELEERLRDAFAEVRLPPERMAALLEQAEPLTQRRGWERWVLGLAAAAALALAVWPTLSDHLLGPERSPAGLRVPEVVAPAVLPTEPPGTTRVTPLPVPDGQRAILVPVHGWLGPAFVPGDQVDVLVTLDEADGGETVNLLAATLLAVDGGTTARLAVTPSQAEKVAHGINVGAVRLAVHLEDGQRGLTVPVDAAELQSGFLVPRALVDVLVTLPQPSGTSATVTLTKGARVLHTALTRNTDDELVGAATLAVDADEAARLAHGAHLGVLSFAVR